MSKPPPAAASAFDAREPDLRIEMFSQPRLLAGVRALVSNLAQRAGFGELHCGQISLAVDEALSNIINHGYEKRCDGRIWLSIWMLEADHEHASGFRIVIEDLAKQVDPSTIRSRDLEDIRPGGLGVFIMREVMDSVVYEKRRQGGMQVTMTKRVPPPPRNSESEGDVTPRTAVTAVSKANPKSPDHDR